MSLAELDQKQLQELYRWIDKIPLSRPKKNIARDFSDGVLMSEVVAHFFPKMIELHNYNKTNSVSQKETNWNTLNAKIFKKMGFSVASQDVKSVAACEKGAIEKVLFFVQGKMAAFQEKKERKRVQDGDKPDAAPPERNPYQVDYNSSNYPTNEREMKEVLGEKDAIIVDLRETVNILQMKVDKLEQLIGLKNAKIQALHKKLDSLQY
mmetsp:Transcript_27437/g.38793  ORF Transcript_27437/g.38793 Transcript_27437/m.38793 type:complete len:208 (+) Transcript_27437:99-722(+)|eukprot:CAMPEP_0175096446 /NCGR_PEP_ID=MMETSP0086_2-20121207/4739_1 /TAXON_ID=136419 /ORGANISM="Unknown Unknown, Strain D1" /LENGTH=207 /DNA_ID=CAMNT_0016369853 /DNA_START=99 /DNA_END=722 /DNA_ORIENTATION=+